MNLCALCMRYPRDSRLQSHPQTPSRTSCFCIVSSLCPLIPPTPPTSPPTRAASSSGTTVSGAFSSSRTEYASIPTRKSRTTLRFPIPAPTQLTFLLLSRFPIAAFPLAISPRCAPCVFDTTGTRTSAAPRSGRPPRPRPRRTPPCPSSPASPSSPSWAA